MASILILIEPLDRELMKWHLIYDIGRRWAGAGHRVRVHAGADRCPPADVVVLHVDRTVIPPEYLEAVRRYPVVVNAGAADLRKRAYSRQILARGEPYEGAVMVKSDLNSGGRVEAGKQKLARAGDPPAAPAWLEEYPVYASPREVPAEVWDDPGRVVEKFLPETRDGWYQVRQYYFFGDAEVGLAMRSRSPEVKGENSSRFAEIPAPAEIRDLRRSLGLDYGKLDFGLRDGRVVLYDANRTPASFALRKARIYEAAVNRLAAGLGSLLREARPIPS